MEQLDYVVIVKKAPLTLSQKCSLLFKNITVEPILMCHILPSVMSNLAMQNLNLEKACRVDLAYGSEICDAMKAGNHSSYTSIEEETVQKLAATAMAYKNIVQSLFPAILLLFLGSWSDRHSKRKPCILLPLSGEAMTALGCLLCTYFNKLPLVYNIIAEGLPVSMTGAWIVMMVGTNAYISDITTPETRTFRIGALFVVYNVSITLGSLVSGIIYKETGFYGVFSLALTINIIGLCYGVFFVQEVPKVETITELIENNENKTKNELKKKSFLIDFFDYTYVIDTARVVFKLGKRNRKKRFCLIMILGIVIIGPFVGESNVAYLMARYRFGWNEVDYSIFNTITFTTQITGSIFSLLLFSKYLKLDDALLGMLSSSSKFLASFIYVFAPNPTIFYLGVFVEMFNSTAFIAMRSIISKLVTSDKRGRVSSLFGAGEALTPFLYGPMYSMIYKATISVLPGAFYLAGGFLSLTAVMIFLWLYIEDKRNTEDEPTREPEESLLRDKAP